MLTNFFKEMTPGSYGVYAILLAYLINLWNQRREDRKLSAADRQANREGFQRLVEDLQHRVSDLQEESRLQGEDGRKLRVEYDTYRKLCQAETDQLRAMSVANQDEIQGLKRKLTDANIEISKLKSA